nr:coiled-coil domain-containing protein 158-like [Aedes albopictus]
MDLQSNVRQTRSRTRAIQQENADPTPPGDEDGMSQQSSEDLFVPSMIDSDGGELRGCVGCDRPNNSEKYMVQCQKCSLWYHFSCANVSTTTVRTTKFVCTKCVPGGDSLVPEQTPSIMSGISSSSSARRTRIDRELKRLEEEKRLMEDLSRQRMEMERALQERELREKLDREKQFIARKHELLSQHDGEEGSVRSVQSSQRSVQRTVDWIRQTEAAKSSGQVVQHSSTPLKATTSKVSPVIGENRPCAGSEVKSIPRTLGSITIGDESEDSLEGAVGADADNRDEQSSDLPLVDLQPYTDLLKVEEVAPAGAIPKINRFGAHCYKRWSAETGELRRQNAQQMEAEHRVIQELVAKHRVDVDKRRKREVELVHQIKSLQLQHSNELKLVRQSEDNLRCQLRQWDRERADMKSQIEDQEKRLIEERKQARISEEDLRGQLIERTKECEALRLQMAELESELQCLRETELQLQSQIEAGRQREYEAIRLQNVAEKEYWDLHDEVQEIINREKDRATNDHCSSPLPPPPVSWAEPLDTSHRGMHIRAVDEEEIMETEDTIIHSTEDDSIINQDFLIIVTTNKTTDILIIEDKEIVEEEDMDLPLIIHNISDKRLISLKHNLNQVSNHTCNLKMDHNTHNILINQHNYKR